MSADIAATGTPGTTTYLRGDGSWTVPDSMFYKSTGTRVYYQTSVLIGGGSLNFTLVINGS